jgi:hypothetical protein
VLYIWDALRHRNVVQLFLQLWFQLSILTYAILQIPQSYNALDELEDERCGAFAVRIGPTTYNTILHRLIESINCIRLLYTVSSSVGPY